MATDLLESLSSTNGKEGARDQGGQISCTFEEPAAHNDPKFEERVSRDMATLQQVTARIRELGVDSKRAIESVLTAVLAMVFTRLHGWSAYKTVPKLSHFFKVRKPELDKVATALLGTVRELVSPAEMLPALLNLIKVQGDAVVRRQMCKFSIDYLRDLSGAGRSCGAAAAKEEDNNRSSPANAVILAGLTDVWSNIRKDTARALFKPSLTPCLVGEEISVLYQLLVDVLVKNGTQGNWQAVDGALHGIHSILQNQIEQENNSAKLNTSEPAPVFDTLLWETVRQRVCLPMFAHGQGDIRGNAVKIYTVFLSLKRARLERELILADILATLNPALSSKRKPAARGSNPAGLLPDFEVVLICFWYAHPIHDWWWSSDTSCV